MSHCPDCGAEVTKHSMHANEGDGHVAIEVLRAKPGERTHYDLYIPGAEECYTCRAPVNPKPTRTDA